MQLEKSVNNFLAIPREPDSYLVARSLVSICEVDSERRSSHNKIVVSRDGNEPKLIASLGPLLVRVLLKAGPELELGAIGGTIRYVQAVVAELDVLVNERPLLVLRAIAVL